MEKLKKTALLAALIILAGISFIGGRKSVKMPVIIERTDTLTVFDTAVIEKPVPTYIRVVDSVLVAVTDTVIRNDTTYLQLPMESKVYEEDSVYRAVVSGYRPSLDTLMIFKDTKYITTTIVQEKKVKSRWGVGINAGYGISRDGLSPYVGLGISYNLLTF